MRFIFLYHKLFDLEDYKISTFEEDSTEFND